jgi:cell division septal protein FtsQ
MTPLYQGRALRAPGPRAAGGARAGRLRRGAEVAAALALVAGLAHVPWGPIRERVAVVREVRVEGARVLDPARVLTRAGLARGADLLALDLDRARQRLLLDPRIEGAEVRRRGPFTIEVRIRERVPVLLVRHGTPWELDSSGVLMAPLEAGLVADVPLLTGPDFDDLPPGTQVRSEPVQRGLAWVEALGRRELQLAGMVSELDVSDPESTELLLMDGTRVLSPAWPPGTRRLSALRVVLADLRQRGTIAREVDLRYEHQVIVRPADDVGAGPLRS